MNITNKLTAILADDEPLALERLNYLLQDHLQEIIVVATAKNGIEAIDKIIEFKPDVAFLDIEMPGMNGLQVVKNLESLPHIVFVTAYDHYAIEAFEANSVDYLLKPVEKERLNITINRLTDKQIQQLNKDQLNLIEELLQPKKKLENIPVKTGDTYNIIKVSSIIYIEARDKYIYIYTNEREYIHDQSLGYMAGQLPDNFIQVHRSCIINIDKIKQVQKYFNNRFIFFLESKNDIKIKSGNTYYHRIKSFLEI